MVLSQDYNICYWEKDSQKSTVDNLVNVFTRFILMLSISPEVTFIRMSIIWLGVWLSHKSLGLKLLLPDFLHYLAASLISSTT